MIISGIASLHSDPLDEDVVAVKRQYFVKITVFCKCIHKRYKIVYMNIYKDIIVTVII